MSCTMRARHKKRQCIPLTHASRLPSFKETRATVVTVVMMMKAEMVRWESGAIFGTILPFGAFNWAFHGSRSLDLALSTFGDVSFLVRPTSPRYPAFRSPSSDTPHLQARLLRPSLPHTIDIFPNIQVSPSRRNLNPVAEDTWIA